MGCKEKQIVRLKSGYFVRVGCGKCPTCLINKRREVALRLHYDTHSPRCYESWFITLTYSDENLEYNVVDQSTGEIYPLASVNKVTLQDYWKRVREDMHYNASLTSLLYYASGEYGDTTKRPHYHAIVYMLGVPTEKKSLRQALQDNWHLCDWSVLDLDKCFQSTNSKAASLYTAKHQVKRCQGVEGQAPYFVLMSKGYGSEFFTFYPTEVDFLKRNMYLVLDNKYKVPAPRYYLDKLDLHRTEEELLKYQEDDVQKLNDAIDRYVVDHRIRDPSHSDDYYVRQFQKEQKLQRIYEKKYFDIMYNKLSKSLKI